MLHIFKTTTQKNKQKSTQSIILLIFFIVFTNKNNTPPKLRRGDIVNFIVSIICCVPNVLIKDLGRCFVWNRMSKLYLAAKCSTLNQLKGHSDAISIITLEADAPPPGSLSTYIYIYIIYICIYIWVYRLGDITYKNQGIKYYVYPG